MAGLTWREVSAPRLDTSDLGQAAEAIRRSFANLGQTFIDRENRLGQEATDAAIANVLAQGSRADLDALRQGGVLSGDRRVNNRQVMEALNTQYNVLGERELQGHTLAKEQALRDFAPIGLQIREALFSGDKKLADQLTEQNKDMPGFNYFMADMQDEFSSDRQEGLKFTENKRQAEAQEADAAMGRRLEQQRIGQEGQRIAMARTEFAQRQTDRKKAEQLEAFAASVAPSMTRMARSYMESGVDADDAWNRHLQGLRNGTLKTGKDWTPEQAKVAEAQFKSAYGQLNYANPANNSRRAGDGAWSYDDAFTAVSRVNAALAGEAQKAERQSRLVNRPYWAVRDIEEAGDKIGKMSEQQLRELYDQKIPWYAAGGLPGQKRGTDLLQDYDPAVAEYVLKNMDLKFLGVNNSSKLFSLLDEVQNAYSNKNDTLATNQVWNDRIYAPLKRDQEELSRLLAAGQKQTQALGYFPPSAQAEINRIFERIRKRDQKKP